MQLWLDGRDRVFINMGDKLNQLRFSVGFKRCFVMIFGYLKSIDELKKRKLNFTYLIYFCN